MAPSRPAERRPFGFTVHPGTLDDYLELTRCCVRDRDAANATRRTVLYHNLHSLYLWFRDARLRAACADAVMMVDGMPVVGLLRLAGIDATREQRLTWVDFIEPLVRLARDEGWTVFHVGQSAAVQDEALARLRARLPGLDIRGRDGYFDQRPGSADSRATVDAINAADTDVLLVGFGTPLQEHWLHAHRADIRAPVAFACGACMEYVAGAVRTPPRLLGRLGLEWTWRLAENPRRFAFRYFIEPVVLGTLLLRAALRPRARTPDRTAP